MIGKNISVLRVGSAAVAACLLSLPLVSGAGAEEELSLAPFTKIDVGYGAWLQVEVGGAQKIMVEDYDRKRFRIEVKGETLIVKARKNLNWDSDDTRLTLTITMAELTEVDVSTGAFLTVSNIDADEFEADISTGAQASLEGRCGGLKIETSTGAIADAGKLECETVRASASTGAQADVYASRSVRASARFGGGIDVHGNPEHRRTSEWFGGNVDF